MFREALHFLGRYLQMELERNPDAANPAKKRSAAFYLEHCHRIIDCKYRDPLALSDLAELLHVNANYLGALLKEQTGESFRDLLNRRRITEGSMLLKRHDDLTITEIARRCGFPDSNYFSTIFRKHTGQSPSSYRTDENAQ